MGHPLLMYAGHSGSHAVSTEQPGQKTSIDPDDSPGLRSPILDISGFTRTQFTVDVGRGSLCGTYAESISALGNMYVSPITFVHRFILLIRHLTDREA